VVGTVPSSQSVSPTTQQTTESTKPIDALNVAPSPSSPPPKLSPNFLAQIQARRKEGADVEEVAPSVTVLSTQELEKMKAQERIATLLATPDEDLSPIQLMKKNAILRRPKLDGPEDNEGDDGSAEESWL
jgi:hypothetical protein